MAISKEILAFVRMQLDKNSVQEVSSAIQQVTKDVTKLEAASKKQAASSASMFNRQLGMTPPGGSGFTPSRGIGGYYSYPQLPSGRPSGQLALPPGYGTFGQNPLYTGVASQFSSSEIINIAPGIDLITNSVNNLADVFDLASARYSAFSDEVIAKAQIVRQIMDETGMALNEAIEASNNMSVGGSNIASNPSVDADVKRVLSMQQNLIDFANGVPPFQEASGAVNDALNENEMSAEDFNNMLADSGETMTDAAKKWKSFGAAFAGFQLRFVGQSLDRFAKQILSPITKYVELVGIASKTSAEWADAQTDVEKATVRIGRDMAQVLLPTMKSLSSVMDKLATFMEQNPALAKGLAYGAVFTAVIGNVLRVAGTMLTATAALKYVLPQIFGIVTAGKAGAIAGTAIASTASSAAGTAAGAAAAGTAVGAAGSSISIGAITSAVLPVALPIILTAIAAVAYKLYSNSELGKSRNAEAAPGQLLSIIAKGVGNIFGTEVGNKAFFAMARFTGAIEDTAKAADEAADKLGPGSAALDAYIAYKQQVKEVEESYEEQRLSVIEDYGKQRVQLEEDYAKEIADIDAEIARLKSGSTDSEKEYRKTITTITKDYQRSSQQELEDYYRRRQELAEDYNINVQRSEEDHQRKMLQMREDHEYNIMQLANERDAFGIVNEERQYEIQRSREEEEYAIEAARRSEDFARRLADMEAEFALERKRRIQEFSVRLQEQEKQRIEERNAEIAALEEKRKMLAEQHAEDLEQLEENQQEQLKLISENKTKELKKMAASFNDSLRLLDASLLGERNIRIAYYTAMSKDLQSWLSSMQGQFSSNLPGYPGNKALGGYTSGVVRTGEEGYEFILRNSTTRTLERAIGGKLTQENVLLGANSGPKSVHINQNFRFDSSLSDNEKVWFRKVAREEAVNGLMEALG